MASILLQTVIYVTRDLVGNNNNRIANCVFCLTKKSNQPEDGSQLEQKHVVERNNVRIALIKSSTELYLTIFCLYFIILCNTTGMSHLKVVKPTF